MPTIDEIQERWSKAVSLNPWAWIVEKEPSFEQWEHEGFTCQIVRHADFGHLCGYVAIPEGHPWYEKDYMSIDAHVHGGLTYHSPGHDEKHKDEWGYKPKRINGQKLWWIGFDCAHSWDIAPLMPREFVSLDAQYRTFEYVKFETNGLARQARQALSEDGGNE